MITSTAAPAWVNFLARSAALKAAMLPVTPKMIRFPSRSVSRSMLHQSLSTGPERAPEKQRRSARQPGKAKAQDKQVEADPDRRVGICYQIVCQGPGNQKCDAQSQ